MTSRWTKRGRLKRRGGSSSIAAQPASGSGRASERTTGCGWRGRRRGRVPTEVVLVADGGAVVPEGHEDMALGWRAATPAPGSRLGDVAFVPARDRPVADTPGRVASTR